MTAKEIKNDVLGGAKVTWPRGVSVAAEGRRLVEACLEREPVKRPSAKQVVDAIESI